MKNIAHLMPKEWLESEPDTSEIPVNRNKYQYLPFGQLEPPQAFERLCCDLLQHAFENDKNGSGEIFKIEPIKGDGKKQYGADIFIKKTESGRAHIQLCEVKRINNISFHDIKEAFKRFEDNYERWGFHIAKFTLICSDILDGNTIAQWERLAKEHSKFDVDFTIKSAYWLHNNIVRYPGIIYKYFHPAWLDALYGKKLREKFESYGNFDFFESSTWDEFVGPEEHIDSNSQHYKNEHFAIWLNLPKPDYYSASCMIEPRNGRYSHVCITLNHTDLVHRYFKGLGTSIQSRQRQFIFPHYKDNSIWYCDLGNCRITLSLGEAEALCDVFDRAFIAYKNKVTEIEELFGSSKFKLEPGSGTNIPLVEITRGLWNLIKQYEEAHDNFNANGKWNIFDSNSTNALRVFTSSPQDGLATGCHAIITARQAKSYASSFRVPDNRVLLTWQPPSNTFGNLEEVISSSKYWDAEFCHDWLVEKLIPQVILFNELRKYNSQKLHKRLVGKRPSIKTVMEIYNFDNYGSSYKMSRCTSIEDISNNENLLINIERLQQFINSTPSPYALKEQEYKNLYKLLKLVLEKSKIVNFPFIHSNLNYLNASDVASLIDAIKNHIDGFTGDFVVSMRIDCLLRSVIACLRDNHDVLTTYEIGKAVKYLKPLNQMMLDDRILSRQSLRLSTN